MDMISVIRMFLIKQICVQLCTVRLFLFHGKFYENNDYKFAAFVNTMLPFKHVAFLPLIKCFLATNIGYFQNCCSGGILQNGKKCKFKVVI